MLRELLQELIQDRDRHIRRTPIVSVEGVYGQEYLKGEAAAWDFILAVPFDEIEGYEAIVETFRQQRMQERESVNAE